MVHSLEMIVALNNRKQSIAGHNSGIKPFVPSGIASKPFLVREFTNRPWTTKELGGAPDVYANYAQSACEAKTRFGDSRQPQTEGPRA